MDASRTTRLQEALNDNSEFQQTSRFGLDNFPMSKDPERCIEFVEPVLNEIRETRP